MVMILKPSKLVSVLLMLLNKVFGCMLTTAKEETLMGSMPRMCLKTATKITTTVATMIELSKHTMTREKSISKMEKTTK